MSKKKPTSRLRVLVADSDSRRRKAIRERIGSKALTFEACSGEEAVRAILNNTRPYSSIFLDHDFGSGWTGVDVAKIITLLPDALMPEEVLIHADNSAAALRILRVFDGSGILSKRVVVKGV